MVSYVIYDIPKTRRFLRPDPRDNVRLESIRDIEDIPLSSYVGLEIILEEVSPYLED